MDCHGKFLRISKYCISSKVPSLCYSKNVIILPGKPCGKHTKAASVMDKETHAD